MSETTTTSAEPGEEPAIDRPVSPIRRAVATVAIVGVVVLGSLGLAASDLAVTPERGGAAARFVPDDGAADLTTAADGTRSVHEHARDTGASLLLELPSIAASSVFASHPEQALTSAQLWRETVTQLDTDEGQVSTLYLLDDAGLSMLTVTGGQVGFAYSPALVVLPADAAPGARWTGEGEALPGGGVRYAVTGSVAAGDDGCLVASTDTRYVDGATDELLLAIVDDATWCPGRGIVEDEARIDGGDVLRFSSEPLEAGVAARAGLAVATGSSDWGDASGWRPRELAFRVDDPAFGDSEQGVPFDGLVATTADGALVASVGSRVVGYRVDESGATRAWAASPGGDLLQLSTVGDVTLVSTAERRLVAYDDRGARLWSLDFPDVVFAPVAAAPDGDVVAVSVDGTLRRVDLATGELVWSQDLRTDIVEAPAVADDVVVVVDRGGAVAARSLSDGEARWEVELEAAERVASDGEALAVQSTYATVWSLDPADGSVAWEREHRGIARSLVVQSGLVVSLGDEGTSAWTIDDASRAWTSDATEALLGAPGGTRFVLVGTSSLEVRDHDGLVSTVELAPAGIQVTRLYAATPHGVRIVQTDTTGWEVGP